MTAEQSSSSLSVERGKEAEVVEVGEEDEVEDISDERYAKMHSKGERLKKKINRKQEQSASWQLRSKREMGKNKQGCKIVLGAWQQKICAWQNA